MDLIRKATLFIIVIVGMVSVPTASAQQTAKRIPVSGRIMLDEGSRLRGVKVPKSIRLVVREQNSSKQSFGGSVSIHDDGTFIFPMTVGDSRLTLGVPSGYCVVSIVSGSRSLFLTNRPGQSVNAGFELHIPPDAASVPELVIHVGVRMSAN